jgi:hypothetical protein
MQETIRAAQAFIHKGSGSEEHMRHSLNYLMKVLFLLTAADVAMAFFPSGARAGSGFFGGNSVGGIGRSEVLVHVDKTSQQMTVSLDGMERYRWPVSTGRPGYDTPSGTYTATSMNEIWYSKEWDNAPMPHAVFFIRDGHAIHGSYDVKNLGRPASHGCVRLSPENAAILFNLVQENGLENTKVTITGYGPDGRDMVARGEKIRRRDAYRASGARYGERAPENNPSPWDFFR